MDALLLGSVVHRVLERMVREVLPRSAANLTQLCDSGPSATALAWPGDPEVFGMLREEAARLLAEQGQALAGLVEVLVAQAWPRLESARDLEWPTPDSKVAVIAAELEGCVQLSTLSQGDVRAAAGGDAGESIYFRADRVDWVEKHDHNQLIFHFGAEKTYALFTTQILRDIAFDELIDTGPPGQSGRGIGKQCALLLDS